MTVDNNKNWGKCPNCGSPVLIDPATRQAESCSNCTAKSSPVGLYLGVFAVILGLVGVIFLVYLGVRMLSG